MHCGKFFEFWLVAVDKASFLRNTEPPKVYLSILAVLLMGIDLRRFLFDTCIDQRGPSLALLRSGCRSSPVAKSVPRYFGSFVDGVRLTAIISRQACREISSRLHARNSMLEGQRRGGWPVRSTFLQYLARTCRCARPRQRKSSAEEFLLWDWLFSALRRPRTV
jgi:hypothetical protein